MPRIPGTNDRQSYFLRAFRTSPTGPAPDQWPAPAILRKWLRRPTFARAIQSVLAALRFQSDFQLAAAATRAANRIAATSAQDPDATLHDLERLLRLAHLRQRFPVPEVTPPPSHRDWKDYIPHPDNPPNAASPVYFDILHDPSRLKAFMELLQKRGNDGYDEFLKCPHQPTNEPT